MYLCREMLLYITINTILDNELNYISSDSDEASKIIERDEAIVNKVLLNTDPVQSLGSWEKHTKVIIFYFFVFIIETVKIILKYYCMLNIINLI